MLLNVLSLALATLAGLAGMLFATWSVSNVSDHHAALIALLCGIVPFWTVRFATDVLSNAVDAVAICYAIDIDTVRAKTATCSDGRQNANHCQKAVEAFGEPVNTSLPR